VSKPEEVPRCVERFDSRPIMGDNEATLLRLWRGEARRGEPGRTVRQTSSASSGSYPQSGTGASTKPNPGKSSLTFGDTLAIPAPALDGDHPTATDAERVEEAFQARLSSLAAGACRRAPARRWLLRAARPITVATLEGRKLRAARGRRQEPAGLAGAAPGSGARPCQGCRLAPLPNLRRQPSDAHHLRSAQSRGSRA
jgi:hypothetical protein